MIRVYGRKLLIPEREKNIGMQNDTGAEIRAFVLPRYHCDVDLADKTCSLWYVSESGGSGTPGNIETEISDAYLTVKWHIDSDVTAQRGVVFAYLQFTGEDYNMRTEDGVFTVGALHSGGVGSID